MGCSSFQSAGPHIAESLRPRLFPAQLPPTTLLANPMYSPHSSLGPGSSGYNGFERQTIAEDNKPTFIEGDLGVANAPITTTTQSEISFGTPSSIVQ